MRGLTALERHELTSPDHVDADVHLCDELIERCLGRWIDVPDPQDPENYDLEVLRLTSLGELALRVDQAARKAGVWA